jgi:hypothetical protein
MWFWNGKNWHLQVSSYRSPDRSVQHFVALPGGGAGEVTRTTIARWTGGGWEVRQVANGPASISTSAIDPSSGHLIVVGSQQASVPDLPPSVDSTFAFDGVSWTPTHLPVDLEGKIGMEVAGYSAGSTIALWGGTQGYGNVGKPQSDQFQATMWYWTGEQWTRIAESG